MNRNIRIDVWSLLRIVKDDKRKTLTYCGVGAIISVIVAFSIPRIYKSSVMLAPETSSNHLTSNISSLASMVGMNMKFGDSDDAIYPEIYPDLMQSTKFLVSLFDIPVTTKDGKVSTTYYDYLKTKQKSPWWEFPLEVLQHVLKSLRSDDTGNTGKPDPSMLSKDDYGIAQTMSNNIDCSVDKKTNVITIKVTAQDALVAKTLADSVKSRLQEFVTDYRTTKARNDLAYMEQLYKEAERDYDKARQAYANYGDNYMGLVRESYKVRMEELENEMQLRYNIYTQVAQQLQLSKAKVQERTPAFTVLQNSVVPVKHSNTPKVFILAAFVLLAFVTRLAILVKQHYKEIFVWQ